MNKQHHHRFGAMVTIEDHVLACRQLPTAVLPLQVADCLLSLCTLENLRLSDIWVAPGLALHASNEPLLFWHLAQFGLRGHCMALRYIFGCLAQTILK